MSRLYTKGRIQGHQRSKHVARPNTSLVQIDGVNSQSDARFYLGKRVAYVYKGQKPVRGSKLRIIWGRVTRVHGNSGIVRAKFAKNIPPQAFGEGVRIMLYPSSSTFFFFSFSYPMFSTLQILPRSCLLSFSSEWASALTGRER